MKKAALKIKGKMVKKGIVGEAFYRLIILGGALYRHIRRGLILVGGAL